jgi:hypothetical protein
MDKVTILMIGLLGDRLWKEREPSKKTIQSWYEAALAIKVNFNYYEIEDKFM